MNNSPILEVQNLRKRIGKTIILKDVNFVIKRYTSHLLLGPNGAGKTTTLKCILGIYRRYKGKILFEGKIIKEIKNFRKLIGYVPEVPYVVHFYRVDEFIELIIKEYKLDKKEISEFLEIFGVTKFRNKLIGKLSKGQRKRLYFAIAFMIHPKLIILDEPFAGIDVDTIIIIKELIKNYLKNKITTFLITSHLLSEIADCIDDLTFIMNGETLGSINYQEILSKFEKYLVYELVFQNSLSKEIIQEFEKFSNVIKSENNKLIIKIEKQKYKEMFEIFSKYDVYPIEIKLIRKSLYDIYKIFRSVGENNDTNTL